MVYTGFHLLQESRSYNCTLEASSTMHTMLMPALVSVSVLRIEGAVCLEHTVSLSCANG